MGNLKKNGLSGRGRIYQLVVLLVLAYAFLSYLLEGLARPTAIRASRDVSAIQHRAALMAPILFPQLYPSCGRIKHPDLPTINSKEELAGYFNSQCKEDMHLYEHEFYKDKEPGVFLEIGALNGVTGSNTLFYERVFGWKGILVEGNPSNAAALQTSPRNRTARFSVATCNIPDDHTPGNLTFTGGGKSVATTIEHAAPSFLERWKDALGKDRVKVPCVPLQYMIDATGLWDIDLLSVDVEGGELFVLQTIDFDATNVRLIIVELSGADPDKDQAVRDLLVSKGFETNTALNKHFERCLQNEIFMQPKYWDRKLARKPLPIQC